MRITYLSSVTLLISSLMFQRPALSLAAAPPTFATPAAVISAAEDAFVNRDFKALADCFDAAGQKVMNISSIQMLTVFASLTPDGDGKASKALLTKYGLTDLSRKGDETDDQFAERLAEQLKDPHGFMVEATPLANPEPYQNKPPKGDLKDVKIDGSKAQATYVINVLPKDTMRQDLTFVQMAGAWKIASAVNFPSPAEVGGR